MFGSCPAREFQSEVDGQLLPVEKADDDAGGASWSMSTPALNVMLLARCFLAVPRGIVVRTEPCSLLLVKLRTGASTAWAFDDEDSCRADSTTQPTTVGSAKRRAVATTAAVLSAGGGPSQSGPPTAAGMGSS